MELREGEREYYCQNGTRDVAKEERKEKRDFPIPSLADNYVEITADLIALLHRLLVYGM